MEKTCQILTSSTYSHHLDENTGILLTQHAKTALSERQVDENMSKTMHFLSSHFV